MSVISNKNEQCVFVPAVFFAFADKLAQTFVGVNQGVHKLSFFACIVFSFSLWLIVRRVRASGKSTLKEGFFVRVDFFEDRKSTRLNSSHSSISYAVFCLKK